MKTLSRCLMLFFLFVSCAGISTAGAADNERILSYHSAVTIQNDSSLDVVETITVRAKGVKIKRGIYRDFPTDYTDNNGKRYVVGFNLIGVSKNGVSEPYHTEKLSNGVRIYIGEKNVFLAPGNYEYRIQYQTTRQIGFFKDLDELYWNVTGNGWEFAMDKVSASVTLPAGAENKIISVAGYTGVQGSKEAAYIKTQDASGVMRFTVTRPLNEFEGFTLAVSWPKGFVREPTATEGVWLFLRDNTAVLAGAIGLFVLLGYYCVTWVLFGRDPAKGVIVPQFQPPANMSPAVMRFISRMGYDDKVTAAAVINCAVKGHLSIEENEGTFTLKKKPGAKIPLSKEETALLGKLCNLGDGSIELHRNNNARIRTAIEGLKKCLGLEFEKQYFLRNIQYFAIGLFLSFAVLLTAGIFTVLNAAGDQDVIFGTIWLSFWSVGVSLIAIVMFFAWKAAFRVSGFKSKHAAIFITLFGLPFFGGEVLGILMLGTLSSLFMVALVLMTILVNVIFYFLLKARTRAGRKVMDDIEGFRMFLSAAEKDRLNRLIPEGGPLEIFERYLPYALALDVEQQWAENFSNMLPAGTAAGESSSHYSPGWYRGSSFSSASFTSFTSSFSSSLTSAISSSSVAPGSRSGGGSSSSGGGSSGGGGGGGGGGGW